jgi:hypothetical protein
MDLLRVIAVGWSIMHIQVMYGILRTRVSAASLLYENEYNDTLTIVHLRENTLS